MSLSGSERGMWRALRRCAAGAVSAGAVVLLAGGCGGVYHLHPNTGQAFYKIMRMHRSGPFPQPQMIGDDAEAALENLDKASRTSDMKRGGGPSFLLPLQR